MFLLTFRPNLVLLFQQQEEGGGEGGGGNAMSHAQNKNLLRCCSSEFHKLLRIVQGAPSPS